MIENCFREVYRVTESGGRLVVNVANLGRKPYIPFSDKYTDLLTNLGFVMRGEIIWQKSKGANAIIAFRFQTSTITKGASEVVAYGTAVKI